MVKPYQDSNGSYKARKRLPDDVREEYGRLHGPRYEAKFTSSPGATSAEAKRQFSDWQAEVEGRIAAIRAQRKGEGRSLSPREARALAGEWYDWFVARHPQSDKETWEQLRDRVREALVAAVGEKRWERAEHPDEFWREDEEVREALRPVLADAGETAQFLAMKAMVLDSEARDRFLDCLYEDLDEALKRLIRMSEGDYSPDRYRDRFPKFAGADKGETPMQLFERWVIERKPKPGSIESWTYVFAPMTEHFAGRSAASISSDEAREWLKGLITEDRSAQTVRNTYLHASNAVFRWAVEQKHVSENPFRDVKITVPKSRRLRETKAFLPQEYRTVLKASLAIQDTKKSFEAAKRWVPWLLAYTGARPSEITQLRKEDVFVREGIHALRITPDAGTTKTNDVRVMPLHEHLVAQGFLRFVADHQDGPLFYDVRKTAKVGSPVKVSKAPAAQVRQRLAAWVRSLEIKDKELSPNHAWRHTFKQIADRAGITERMSDSITGHAHKSVGASYGAPTLDDMAEAMKKFPRYVID